MHGPIFNFDRFDRFLAKVEEGEAFLCPDCEFLA